MKVLLVLGHDNYDKSVQNRKLIDQLAGVKDVTVLNLWEKYGAQNFKLTDKQVQEDAQAMLAADRIIFQYPLYWYNMPWCLKLWQDQVFTAIAFSDLKEKVAGKEFGVIATTASPSAAYLAVQENGHTLVENITWLHRGSAVYMGMKYHGALFFYPDADEKEVFANYLKFVAE